MQILQTIDILVISFISLFFGWLGSLLTSYFKEKGKNIATKEDINEITKQIEAVKHKFNTISQKSSELTNRQIQAFDIILEKINEIRIYCFKEAQESEHVVTRDEQSKKSTFYLAVNLRELTFRHCIFIPKNIYDLIIHLTQSVYTLGHMELNEDVTLKDKKQPLRDIQTEIEKITLIMKKEFFNE